MCVFVTRDIHNAPVHQYFSGVFLQTAQTWANVGVCSASCAHALDSMFVCIFSFCLFVCLFVCLTGNLGDWVS